MVRYFILTIMDTVMQQAEVSNQDSEATGPFRSFRFYEDPFEEALPNDSIKSGLGQRIRC